MLFRSECLENSWDGSILCFEDAHRDPRWSFAKTNEEGLVVEVQEKVPISQYATAGMYAFSKGIDFVQASLDMIVRNERVNGEFYTCPTYNYLIAEKKKIGMHLIHQDSMHDLGTPEGLEAYLETMILQRA